MSEPKEVLDIFEVEENNSQTHQTKNSIDTRQNNELLANPSLSMVSIL